MIGRSGYINRVLFIIRAAHTINHEKSCMKIKGRYLIICLFVAIFFSCKKSPKGKWPDIIQLSGKEFNFNPTGDSVMVSAKGKWWAVSGIRLDTHTIYLNPASPNDPCNFAYADSLIQISGKTCNTLFIKMNENKSNASRTLYISLWAGDYSDGIKIIQNKK